MPQDFTIAVTAPNGRPVSIPAVIKMQPQRFSASARGGFDIAELQCTGPKDMLFQTLLWLNYGIAIRNPDSNQVWSGHIEEALVTLGGQTVGLSLKRMVNRVQVSYTTLAPDGTDQEFTTDWAEDTDSISRYGQREARVTLADASQAQAEARRDAMLEARRKPLKVITSDESASAYVTVQCIGKWHTLAYRYYANDEGLEEYTTGGAEQVLGVGVTSDEIGFDEDNEWIFNVAGLQAGDQFVVSGSASNNGVKSVRSVHEQDTLTYSADTIAFAAPDDITDSANGFGDFLDGDVIQILDTASNDGVYELGAASAGALEVTNTVTNESAGSTFTFQRRSYIRALGGVVDEVAGATVTITAYGVRIAQKFTQEVDADWTVAKIAIRIKRVGAPGDNVKVALHSDSSGDPGTELDSATVTGIDIGTEMDWVEFELNNTDTISFGTDYWIVVSRSGSNSITDYYAVDVDEDLGYTLGNLKLYTGSAWVARATDADMPFRVLGAIETTQQISNIVGEADFVDEPDIVDASGIESNQFRDGELDAQAEIERLLDSGTDNGRRLIATMSPEGHLRVREQPSETDLIYGKNKLFWDGSGQLRDQSGRLRPLGELPVGYWITLTEIPSAVGVLSSLSPFFCERAEYDVLAQRWYLEAEGAPDLWQIAQMEMG